MIPVTPEVVGSKSDAVYYAGGSDAPVVLITALDGLKLSSPLETKVLLPGPKASLLEHRIYRGQVIPPHRFAHDFINCLVSGRMRVTLAGQSYEAEARDGWSGAHGVELALEALEDSTLLEWMGPPHLLNGDRLITWGAVSPSDSHIFSKWKDTEEYLVQPGGVEGTTEYVPPGEDSAPHLRVLVPGPYGSVLWASMTKGKWALHTHHHHWVCYLIKGMMKQTSGGTQVHICNAGDIWAAQSGAEHCTEGLEDTEVLEFKWPAPPCCGRERSTRGIHTASAPVH